MAAAVAAQKLQVTVVEAQNLLAKDKYKDRDDSSDPYVRLKHGKTKLLTTVHRETLNPQWDETFKFDIDKTDATLLVEVYDKDLISDDFLGRFRVELAPLLDGRSHDKWFDLLDKKDKLSKGKVRLRIQALSPKAVNAERGAGVGAATGAADDGSGDLDFDDDAGGASAAGGVSSAAGGPADESGEAAGSFVAGTDGSHLNVLTVKVKEARNLGSPKYDAFCMVVHGTQVQKTLVIDDNMHPKWNEQFVFEIQTADPNIVFEVYDKEILAKDKFLGQVTLDLENYRDGEVHDEWHALTPKAGDSMMKRLAKGQFRKQTSAGELRVEISLSHRKGGVQDWERSTFIAKSSVDQSLFEGIYFLLIILVVVALKIVYDI